MKNSQTKMHAELYGSESEGSDDEFTKRLANDNRGKLIKEQEEMIENDSNTARLEY